MKRRAVEAVVVGAGPAGLSAALALAESGVPPLVLDENPRPGGQIFRQLPESFDAKPRALLEPPSHERGHRLLHDVAQRGIEIVRGASVFDAGVGVLRAEIGGAAHEIRWKRLIVAAGASDRALPFPGWTLPGVLTAGAAQVLVRGAMVRPGVRAVVAGTGPLLLPTITSLLAAGVEVVGAFEAQPFTSALLALPSVLRSRARSREARHYLSMLRRHRVSLQWGRAVVRADGDGAVQRVRVAKLTRAGLPIAGTERELACDLLCVGFGLVPAIELPRLLGCAVTHDDVRGGFVPVCDADLATSVAGVAVAGETAGIGGADVAITEGRLAGLAAAAALGRPVTPSSLARARRARTAERRAADALLRRFPVRPGLLQLADDDTVVCRCEDVTLKVAQAASALHGDDLRAIKLGSRAGMGPCQGRICQPLLADLLRHRFGSRRAPTCPVAQPPLKPVSVETFCDEG
jgi:NADPH-dependent 2,4-dienoyl-CoA reductase/sulfur reductase-like enzyme